MRKVLFDTNVYLRCLHASEYQRAKDEKFAAYQPVSLKSFETSPTEGLPVPSGNPPRRDIAQSFQWKWAAGQVDLHGREAFPEFPPSQGWVGRGAGEGWPVKF